MEGYETSIKEQVRIGREQQPVHAIEALLGRFARSPRLDMTGNQQGRIRDSGEPAFLFNAFYVCSKCALASSRLNDGLSYGRVQSKIGEDVLLLLIIQHLFDGLKSETVGASARKKVAIDD